MGSDLVPAKAKAKGLTEDEERIAYLMVRGLPTEETILDKTIKADWPLKLEEAAKFCGYRLKRARSYLSTMPEFRALLSELVRDVRKRESSAAFDRLEGGRREGDADHAATLIGHKLGTVAGQVGISPLMS